MTFAAPGPIATQTVVAVASIEYLVSYQGAKNGLEHVIEVGSVFSRLKSRLKDAGRSIVRTKISHQIVNSSEALDLAGLDLC